MKAIRAILKPVLLFLDSVTSPKPMTRTPDAQAKVDLEATKLSLYHFEACPFCIRVRRVIRRLALPIELRDVKKNKAFDKELVAGGGRFQVPCLRIVSDDGGVRWLYESAEINKYLEERFSATS